MKKLSFLFSLSCLIICSCSTPKTTAAPAMPLAERLVQAQLDAYNGHDLTAFLAPYSEEVKIYEFPNNLLYGGKATMREQYQFVENTPDLHCELMNRVVVGNTVIDHERVTISKDRPSFQAIAIYKIEGNEIVEVYFIQ